MRPASSVTSRKRGEAAETDAGVWAREGDAKTSHAAVAAQIAIRTRGFATAFTHFSRQRNFHRTTKKPHETPWGFRRRSFSRRAEHSAAREGGLAYGFSADYSGGTAADSHGLPRFPCLQIEFRVYAASAGVSMHGRTLSVWRAQPRLSDSSNSVFAFRSERAGLPANPRDDRVRSRKYSWNA